MAQRTCNGTAANPQWSLKQTSINPQWSIRKTAEKPQSKCRLWARGTRPGEESWARCPSHGSGDGRVGQSKNYETNFTRLRRAERLGKQDASEQQTTFGERSLLRARNLKFPPKDDFAISIESFDATIEVFAIAGPFTICVDDGVSNELLIDVWAIVKANSPSREFSIEPYPCM